MSINQRLPWENSVSYEFCLSIQHKWLVWHFYPVKASLRTAAGLHSLFTHDMRAKHIGSNRTHSNLSGHITRLRVRITLGSCFYSFQEIPPAKTNGGVRVVDSTVLNTIVLLHSALGGEQLQRGMFQAAQNTLTKSPLGLSIYPLCLSFFHFSQGRLTTYMDSFLILPTRVC